MVATLVRDGKEVAALAKGETGAVLLNQTPFYGEAGGQVGDTGLMTGDGMRFRVTDTQKKAGDLLVHSGVVEEGSLKPGLPLTLDVDHARRSDIRRNHSATHLLHEALRQVLGDHVAQKGSLVAPDRLRFDISHPKPISAEELARVEDIANEMVLQNSAVTTRLMAVDDAIASGARALFGEKYGDEVRVVAMGDAGPGANALGWSVELCGGTHVRRTGDIGLVSVVGRERRRRRGAPHRGADRHAPPASSANHIVHIAKTGAAELKVAARRGAGYIAALLDERKRSERRGVRTRGASSPWGAAGAARDRATTVCATVGDVKLLARAVSGIEVKDLQEPRRRRQEAARLRAWWRSSARRRQGRLRGRRHGRPDRALQRRRSGAPRRRGARRQGRRRPPRHGPGRRPRRRQGGRRSRWSRHRRPADGN